MAGVIINAGTLTGVFLNTKTTFNKAMEKTVIRWPKTAMLVPISGLSVEFPWTDVFPSMIEWQGSKVHKSMAAYAATISVKEWETTIDIARKYIEADQLGMFGPRAQSAGEAAAKWPDQRINAVKNGAFTGIGLDGQYFYDDDHVVAEASVSNKGVAPLSNATVALADASFGAARLAILSLKDKEGNPLELMPDVLEVPPALEKMANMLMNNDRLADETPNPYKGLATVEVNPGLTSTTAWFLHVTNNAVKPFVFVQRKAPVFVSQVNMDSPQVFDLAVYSYGAEASGIGAYGPWQLSYGSTGLGA